MSALRRTVKRMVNQWQMERLVREYQRDAYVAAHRRGVSRSLPQLRIRVGRALVALGVRLARESGGPGSRGHVVREDLVWRDPRPDRILRMQPRLERGPLLRQIEVEHRLL
jgi:hypothetical protein